MAVSHLKLIMNLICIGAMTITIHPGQRHSCSDTESQRSSPPVHSYIGEEQAKSLPSKFVFHWFFQPTSLEGFHLKNKGEKNDTCFITCDLPSQYNSLLSQIIKKNERRKDWFDVVIFQTS